MMSNDFNDTFAYASTPPTEGGVTLQWATGLTTTDRRIVAGWLIEAGKDEALDEALLATETPRVTIKHGNGNTVTHWHLEIADLLLVAQDSDPEGRGVAFRWVTLEDGRQQSRLKARVYVRALVDAGYTEMLTVSVKSTLTTDIRTAFARLYDMTAATGNTAIPIYAWWLPTGPGKEVARGKAQTKTIAPPVAHMPDTLSRDWLVARYAKKTHPAIVAQVERDLPAVIAWSVKESDETLTDTVSEDAPPAEVAVETTAPVPAPAPTKNAPPKNVDEARQRFFARYGATVGRDWHSVRLFFNDIRLAEPTTIDGWVAIATRIRDEAAARAEQSAA